jgi:3-keto steroid reductase
MSNQIFYLKRHCSGVGFGICHRLVLQFSHRNAPDTQIKAGTPGNSGGPYSCAGMTIIMACRNKKRAEVAREKLFGLLDAEIAKQKTEPGYDGHAELFRQNLRIEVHHLDLAIMETIFHFGEELSQKWVFTSRSSGFDFMFFARYPYVSHLICNAGVASFTGVDYSVCLKQFCISPVAAVSTPEYYIQRRGELSVDGFGWVWQCNVFGHYALVRYCFLLIRAPFSSIQCPAYFVDIFPPRI